MLVPVAMAALLAFWNLAFGLPFVYRPDEDTIVGRSVRMVVDHSLDPIYPNWLPLGFYVYAFAEWIGSVLGANNLRSAMTADPTAAYLIGRIVSGCMAVAMTALVFFAARRLYGLAAAVLAGVMAACAPLVVRQAHFATVDGIMAMFVAATLLATVRARTLRGLFVAGVLAGLAAAIKYNGAVAFVLPATAALLTTDRVRGLLYAVAGAALGFGLPSLDILLHLRAYLHTAAFLGRDLYQHVSPEPVGWLFDPTVVLPVGLGFGSYALVLAGIALAVRRRLRAEVPLLTFTLAYLVVLGSGHENFYRYLLPLFPVLFVLGGGWLASVPPRFVPYALAAATVLLLPSLYASIWTDHLLGEKDTRTYAAQWIDANVPAGTTFESQYYAGPYYDSALVHHQSQYINGSLLAASFLQGRFTSRYHVRVNQRDGATVGFAASGPPWQGPVPAAGAGRFRISPYARGATPAPGIYDPLDSFYLPIWGFEGLERMGPSIAIYNLP